MPNRRYEIKIIIIGKEYVINIENESGNSLNPKYVKLNVINERLPKTT